jgi:ABC-type transport system involved in multi-copper enzyme maturation permease subunit
MRSRLRNIRLIGGVLLLEAWRRREIYAIVIVTLVLLAGLRFVHFFDISGLGKFYREISLKVMNVTTAMTVILLAARQLPREFKDRTIYPLLAKPISRLEFLLGKFGGVLLAGLFCYGLFVCVFLVASVTLQAPIHMGVFAQAVYLQALSIAVVAALTMAFSMLFNTDAAVTLATIIYITSQVMFSLMSYLYDGLAPAARWGLLFMHYVIPQLTLLDMSSKAIHSVTGTTIVWRPLPFGTMLELTIYASAYVLIYLAVAYLMFRRRPL